MKVTLWADSIDLIRKESACGPASSYLNYSKALSKVGISMTHDPAEISDIIHIHQVFGLNSLKIIERAKKAGKKIIIYTHTTPGDYSDSFNFSNLCIPAVRHLVRYFYSKADYLLFPSSYTLRSLRALGIHVPGEVVSNGVDTEIFRFSKTKRINFRQDMGLENSILVGTVAQLFPKKGIKDFYSLAKSFPQYNFSWFGTVYPWYVSLKPKLYGLPPKNLRFEGRFEGIISAYSAMDAFVFLTQDENEGMVVLEAASVGVPMVIRDIPVFEDWLTDEYDCLKFRTFEELKERLLWVVEDKSLRRKLVSNAYKIAKRNNLANIGKRLDEVYSRLLRC